MNTIKLTCLRNADGDVVGWFNDYGVEMAARREWDKDQLDRATTPGQRRVKCRSKEVAVVTTELENVEPGDGDRVDYCVQEHPMTTRMCAGTNDRASAWMLMGAASVEIQRFLINKYRRPGKSNRDADLGGPVDAAGVLYVLVIKAPK